MYTSYVAVARYPNGVRVQLETTRSDDWDKTAELAALMFHADWYEDTSTLGDWYVKPLK